MTYQDQPGSSHKAPMKNATHMTSDGRTAICGAGTGVPLNRITPYGNIITPRITKPFSPPFSLVWKLPDQLHTR